MNCIQDLDNHFKCDDDRSHGHWCSYKQNCAYKAWKLFTTVEDWQIRIAFCMADNAKQACCKRRWLCTDAYVLSAWETETPEFK